MKKIIILLIIFMNFILINCEKKSEQRQIADCVIEFMTNITTVGDYYLEEFVNNCKSDSIWSNFPSWKIINYKFEKELDRGIIDLKRYFLPSLCGAGSVLANNGNDLINEFTILAEKTNCELIENEIRSNLSKVDVTERGNTIRYDWSCDTHMISYYYTITTLDNREKIFSINIVDKVNCFIPSGKWQVLNIYILDDLNDIGIKDVSY